MKLEYFNRQELERIATLLVNQAHKLIGLLGVDVSGARAHSKGSPTFRRVANAYDGLAQTEKKADRGKWAQIQIEGRNGSELMQRLWEVREGLRTLNCLT
jgi:hypothetical protein